LDSFEPDETTEKHALPSFPDSPMKRGFSQSAIKESVKSEQESEELEDLPPKFQLPKMREMNEFTSRKIADSNASTKTEDVYVKIDRFHSARRALNSARDKLKEIEELMKKIRETKMREEQELSSWEDEIESVKSKVEDVTKSIFEKVE
jgi:hypothetical protein